MTANNVTYVIRETRHYYGPKQVSRHVVDSLGEALEFDSRAAAREWIDAAEASAYELGHNEYAVPTYRIIAV